MRMSGRVEGPRRCPNDQGSFKAFLPTRCYRLPREQHLASPFLAQVLPFGINAFDQRNLLASSPTLQLLFAADCVPHIVKALIINRLSTVVFAREAFD